MAINAKVKGGVVTAPIFIGRDYYNSAAAAFSYGETEGMRDGSGAIIDWPVLCALPNAVFGARGFESAGGRLA